MGHDSYNATQVQSTDMLVTFLRSRRAWKLVYAVKMKGRQAEPHTHVEKKKKPMNGFSHVYHMHG